jgi:hypothetical protein
MDSIMVEYGVDQAAIGPAGPSRWSACAAWLSVTAAARRSRASICRCDGERSSPSSARTARARPRRLRSSRASSSAQRDRFCVLGHDPATAGGAWRDRVGVVLQEAEPEPGLSVRECLAMYAGFYRAPRDIGETIDLTGLAGKKTRWVPGCRAASGAGSISLSHSSATQSSSSWTSRPLVSTRPPAPPPGRSLPAGFRARNTSCAAG